MEVGSRKKIVFDLASKIYAIAINVLNIYLFQRKY